MRAFADDVIAAARQARRGPGAALTLIAVLGLTAGVTAAGMQVVAAFLWRPLPYPDAHRLAVIDFPRENGPQPRDLQQIDWAGLDDVAELVVASDVDVFTVLGAGVPFSIDGRWMSADVFAAFGIVPAAGRFFTDDEARRGERLAVIGHQAWRDHFGGDPSVVGRSITVRALLRQGEARTFTVVGVLPPRFWHLESQTGLMLPLEGSGTPSVLRLRPGATTRQAADRATALVRAQAAGVGSDWRATVRSAQDAHVDRIRPMLVATASGLLLLAVVAFANLAFMQMARGVARQREAAVRSVLGAGAGVLAWQAIAEGLVIAAGAAPLAVAIEALIAIVGLPPIERYAGRIVPGGWGALAADPIVIVAIVAICVIAALVLELVRLTAARSPALQAALAGHPASTDTPARLAARQSMTAAQVAVAFCLLVAATLMMRTAWHLGWMELGFDAAQVLSANVTLHESAYPSLPQRRQFFTRLVARLEALPEVTSAGLTGWIPFRVGPVFGVEPEGEARVRSIGASIQGVNAAYFTALRMRLVEGRLLTADDRAGRPNTAVISRALARALWDTSPAVGRAVRIRFGNTNPGRPGFGPYAIVGVVDDSLRSLIEPTPPQVYLSFDQQPLATNAFLQIRTTRPPMEIAPVVARLLAQADASVPLAAVNALDTIVDAEGLRPRFLARVLAGFALLSSGVAAIGLWAVSAWLARQRQREAALRVALGAGRGAVALLIARRGLVAVAAGLGLGWIASGPLANLMAAELHGVSPSDGSTRLAVAGLLAIASLLTLWTPAWRAATRNPAALLRHD